jgi:aminoglycoside phosphotransferase (APT) family kinase protein
MATSKRSNLIFKSLHPVNKMESERKLGSMGTPVPELEIDAPLVYSLLAEQHPALKHLSIELVDSGWDNAMFRLGDRFSVRLPRRQAAAKLIENEQIWLPLLADRLSLPVPTPYKLGKPGEGYPWRWSILPWLTGITADREEPRANQVKPFVSFLRSLHVPAPFDAPRNEVRGVPLTQRAVSVEEQMQRLETKTNLITSELKNTWNKALNASIDVQPTWLHGDLHPRNILVENSAIAGIIDWGDITSGDLATDLASIWMLFSDRNARQQAMAEYTNISEATLQRAKGWAILFGVVLLETGLVDNPRHALMGERTLRRISEDT